MAEYVIFGGFLFLVLDFNKRGQAMRVGTEYQTLAQVNLLQHTTYSKTMNLGTQRFSARRIRACNFSYIQKNPR